MCGRFSLWSDKNKILQHYGLETGPDILSSYNIPPSFEIPALRLNNGKELVNLHWGFIPFWAKDTKMQPANARADSIATKPMFRDAFKQRRCLVPVNGYFEWYSFERRKQPYFIRVKGPEVFSFAGIWTKWDSPDKSIESCALITTEAPPQLEHIHDRMPVIIDPAQYDEWLDKGGIEMLKPYQGEMTAYTVSTAVNTPRNQGAELIQAL